MLCPRSCLLQFVIICATLFQYSFGAPWENNNAREFDLEWQCEQFCDRLKGNLTYNSPDSECICAVNKKRISANIDSNHLVHKLNNLGFNFKVIDKTMDNKIIKRETAAEKAKKMSEIKGNGIGENPVPNPENEGEEKLPLKERLNKLKKKILNTKNEKPDDSDNNALEKPASNLIKDEKPEDKKEEETPKDTSTKAESSKKNAKEDILLKLPAKKVINIQQNKKNLDKGKETKIEIKLPVLNIRPENDNESPAQKRIQELRKRIRDRIESRRAKLNI